jgi:hypothetical protein
MFRDLFLIGSFVLVGTCWYMLPEGRIRNASLLLTSAIAIFLLLSRGSPENTLRSTPLKETDGVREYEDENLDTNMPREKLVPSRSLGECLRFHTLHENPNALRLLSRIQEYRAIVIKIAKERGGTGTIWRDSDDDPRVRSCLCGTLTREELIKGLEIQEHDPDPPKVGAGMGIEHALKGIQLAEDGKPAKRILVDPVADRYFNALMAHTPSAKYDLMLARERYIENVLRRLVGPLDGRGRPIVPLCVWKKRFDGDHYKEFEDLEHKFMG